MKTIFCLLFFLISFSTLAQQPFAPIGAKWYYSPHTLSPPGSEYFSFESVADTVVDNQIARKIIYTKHTAAGSEIIPDATVVMYGDGDKIYYHFDNQFHILYDFSATAGDTLLIKLGEFANYFQLGRGIDIIDSTIIEVEVGSIEMTTIDNENLRALSYKTILDFDPNELWGYAVNLNTNPGIIERIGNIQDGLFGESLTQTLGGFSGKFRCYEDPNFSYKNPDFNFPCDYISGLDAVSEIKTTHFSIFPNPSSHSFFIKNKTAESSLNQIQLFDFKGEMILEKSIYFSKNQSIEINTNHLSSGIYFLKLSNDKYANVKKIIVQN